MKPRSVVRESNGTRSRGFTLVELLVVIAIIGVLIALLLPAVQAAREAARRLQCQNTMHNLAIAVANFETQKGALPQSNDQPLTGNLQNKVSITNTGSLSWLVRVLPFMEQQALYDQFDLERTSLQQDRDLQPYSAQPAFMLCPSDQALGRFYQSRKAGNIPFGKANYVAYVSPEHAECMPVAKGAMIHIPQPLSHIEDGTSNTIMLTEIRTRDHENDPRGAWTMARIGSSIIAADMHGTDKTTRICNQSPTPDNLPNPIWSDLALPPNAGVGADTPRDDLVECPEPAEADLDRMPCWTRGDTTAAPRSLHVGGVNSARIDGSVQWITNEIEPVILGSLVCVNDGLAVDLSP